MIYDPWQQRWGVRFAFVALIALIAFLYFSIGIVGYHGANGGLMLGYGAARITVGHNHPGYGWFFDIAEQPHIPNLVPRVWQYQGGWSWGFTGTTVSIPLIYPTAALLLSTVVLLRSASQRPFAPRCASCGFNLTGNTSGRCPECGAAAPASPAAATRDDAPGATP